MNSNRIEDLTSHIQYLRVTCVTRPSTDAFLFDFNMVSQIPGTGVFSLESAFSFPQNSGLGQLELGGIQSRFSVSGSVAEALNLHERAQGRPGKARAQGVYGYEGQISVHSSLSDFVNKNGATATGAGGSLEHVTADVGNRAVLDHGWGALDTYGYPDTMEDSLR